MYHISNLIGKTITIRSIKGDEYIAKLLGVDPDLGLLTVSEPRVVVVDADTVMLFPFALTARTDTVTLHTAEVFAVLETMPEAATDYAEVVSQAVAQTLANDQE